MTTRKDLSVIVCSLGRPEALTTLLLQLNEQSVLPGQVIFVVTSRNDVEVEVLEGSVPGISLQAEVIFSSKGSSIQRNVGLDHIGSNTEIVVFLDDDYIPTRLTIEGVCNAFELLPYQVSGISGHLIADGINSAGISTASAFAMIEAWEAQNRKIPTPEIICDTVGMYGCNMACRVSQIGDIRFDEELPLYAWQEDVDFASRIKGRKVLTNAFAGVHCGLKKGREKNAKLLGYSQVANTWYLWRKGTMPAGFAVRLTARNIIANHVKMLCPEPWIDRKARAVGNWIALKDIVIRNSHPKNILKM